MTDIADRMSEGVNLVRLCDGRIVYTNPSFEKMFGYKPGELMGKQINVVSAEAGENSADEIFPSILKSLERRGRWIGDVQEKRKNGEAFWTAVSVSEFDHPLHGPVWISVHRDITDRKRREQERRQLESKLQRAQKLTSLRVMAGGIAHDFNNMLMTILGHAELALTDLPADSPIREHTSQIQAVGKQAAELAGKMLTYSGQWNSTVMPLDLNKTIRQLEHLCSTVVSEKTVLKYEIATRVPCIEVNPEQIRQGIVDLIRNASEAIGEESGVITVSTGSMECGASYLSEAVDIGRINAEGTYSYIEVADTGCGMDEETQQSLFDPFFTTNLTGRGLGLAVVLGIVRLQKGAIILDSEIGKGTTIRILFPASEKTEQALASDTPNSNVEAIDKWKGSGTILVVDDEAAVQEVTKMMIEKMGFDVLTAWDGREAVEILRARGEEIGIIVLDLSMPKMDGHEAFEIMCKIQPNVKVVIISGFSKDDVICRFSEKKPAAILQKPFTFSVLTNTIRRIMEG